MQLGDLDGSDENNHLALDTFLNSDYGLGIFRRWCSEHSDSHIPPDLAPEDVELHDVDPEDDFRLLSFFVCDNAANSRKDPADAKWHLPDLLEPEATACHLRSLRLRDMIPVGSGPPARLCQMRARCLKARPDAFAILPSE